MFLKHVLGTGSNIRHLPCKSDPIPRRHRLCRAVLHKGGPRGSWSRDCALRHGAIGASSYTCLISDLRQKLRHILHPPRSVTSSVPTPQVTYVANFLAVATTTLLASAIARREPGGGPNIGFKLLKESELVLARTLPFLSIYCLKMMVVGMAGGARRVVSVSFFITTVVGTLMTIFLVAFAKPLIRIFTGGSGAAELTIDMYGHAARTLDKTLFRATPVLFVSMFDKAASRSMMYVRIRGLASIPTLLCMVAQAACIGAKDSVSPMKAVGVVAIFNIILDYIFVGPLKQRVAGAAIATAIAQIAGAVYLYMAVESILSKQEATEYHGENVLFGSSDDSSSSRSPTSGLFAVPTYGECVKFSQFAGPLFVISLSRGYTWNILTPAAGAYGVVPLAAHQVAELLE